MLRLITHHLLALAILLAPVIPAAADDAALEMAPVNPAFTDYMASHGKQTAEATTQEGYGLGYLPPPVDLEHLTGAPVFRKLTYAYPSTYDLRTTGKLTPVKNQGSCGSCWAFATCGSMESWLKPGETWDFSENNLKNLSGFDIACCDGGDAFMSTAYLARWAGPVRESDDPYSQSGCVSPAGLAVQKHLQRAMFIPNRANSLDNDSIKYAVMNYGAVFTSFYFGDAYYSAATTSYYCNTPGVANHAVCIVGWDDNYSKANFSRTPAGDGAFIAKNSWGTGWGEAGYFYVSYYDVMFGRDNAVFQADPTSNYARVYQYDPYGWVGSFGYGNQSAGFANVFTAQSSEPLVAVSFYTMRPGSTYTLKVYLDPTSGPINTGGPVLTQSGAIDTPGYSTIVLNSAVALTAGHRFSAAVWLTTPGYTYPVAVEYPSPGYSINAGSHSGESFVSSNGTSWADLLIYQSNGSVCLKAFTASGPVLAVTPDTGLSSSGSAGGPFSPPSATYTLNNTGSAQLSWTAGASTWLIASPASGTLNPGQSVDVTVSINSQANSLTAGSYDQVVTFTNATNGVGNTTRAVHLAVAGVSLPAMTVTPSGGLTASGPPGGPFSPSSLAYTVANTSDSAIDFSVTHNIGENWITVYNALPAHVATQVTASINSLANALTPGTYTDTMTFTNLTNGQGNTTRQIRLTVVGGQLDVTPMDGLASSGSQGGPFDPSDKQFTLTNKGAASISWSVSHGPSATWLTLSSASGVLAPGASTTVTASINANATALPGGSYTDTISFTNMTDGRGNTTRDVQLTVYSGRLEVTPAEGFTSSGAPGGPFAPLSKQYIVSNPGNSSINWAVTHSPLATWLDMPQTSGTLAAGATTTLTFTINSNAAGLVAGVYSDTINFTNTTNGVGSTTRPVSLTVASRSLTSVDVLPATLDCPSTDPRQIYATAYFSDGTSMDITSAGQWTSSVPANATVNSSGVVTPVKLGSSTVTCSYTSGGVTRTDTCAVSVRFRTFYYLLLAPASYLLYQQTPVQFQCRARLSDGWTTVTDVCTWTSSDPTVATVDRSGLVTPLKNGSTAIRAGYTFNGAVKSIQANVQVSAF